MKKRTKLMLGLSAMLLAAGGVAATGTFAWYSATAASKSESITALGDLTIASAGDTLNAVKFTVTAHTGAPTSLVYTNRTGHSYMRSGDVYTEVNAADDGSVCGTGKKQGSTTWDVKITKVDGTSTPDTNSLASIAGEFTINVTAGGSVKLSLTQTSTLGSKETGTPSVNFADPSTGGSVASGALGATATATVPVMKIVIAADGSVKYKIDATASFASEGTAWADPKVAVQSAPTYYGLEVLNATAEPTPAVSANSKLTPDVAEIS